MAVGQQHQDHPEATPQSPSKRVCVKSGAPSVLQVKKLCPEAQLPKRGSAFSAGYDLHSAIDIVIPPKGKGLVKTGLALSIPYGHYGRVAPRSGLAWKNFIDVGGGVIDSDYRGELLVVLFNFGEEEFAVRQGDRISQLIIERISNPEMVEVAELSETVRGVDGFGSTGK